MLRRFTLIPAMLVLLVACGDDGRDDSIYSTNATVPTTLDGEDQADEATADESAGDESDPSTSEGDGDGDAGDGDGDPPGDGDGDGDPTDGNPCGNGVIDPGEECDGGNLGGSSCAAQGFDGGVLGCDAIVCVFDTSGCTTEPSNECDAFCGGCSCPSFECTMCCALKDKVDSCGGGTCSCF